MLTARAKILCSVPSGRKHSFEQKWCFKAAGTTLALVLICPALRRARTARRRDADSPAQPSQPPAGTSAWSQVLPTSFPMDTLLLLGCWMAPQASVSPRPLHWATSPTGTHGPQLRTQGWGSTLRAEAMMWSTLLPLPQQQDTKQLPGEGRGEGAMLLQSLRETQRCTPQHSRTVLPPALQARGCPALPTPGTRHRAALPRLAAGSSCQPALQARTARPGSQLPCWFLPPSAETQPRPCWVVQDGVGQCEVVQDASPGTPARAGPGRRWRIPPTISETRHGHTEPCPAPGAAVSSSTSTLPVSQPLPVSPPRRPPLTPSVLPLSWCSRGAPGCPRQWGGHPGGGRGHFQRVASGKGPRAAPAGSGPALLSCC